MGVDKSGDRQTVIKLMGRRSAEAQSATTIRRPPPLGRESCLGSEMWLLPLGACRTLELCAGAVNFRLDCAERRVYIDTFTYAAYDSGQQAQKAFLELCELAASFSAIEDVEDAWLVMQRKIGVISD